MMKDVFISIKGIQGMDGDSDTIEFMTEGKYGMRNGEYYISYNEDTILDTHESVKTGIYIKNKDSVILKRTGAVESRMLIERGRRSSCLYATPQGELSIGISGEDIECNLDSSGGEIKLKYAIDSGFRLISKNEVNISIREV